MPDPHTMTWPTSAETYVADAADKYVNDEWAWKDCYQADPRPNAGVTCNGRYLPEETRGHTRTFACLPCGLRKVIKLNQFGGLGKPHKIIKFACPACSQQQKHWPVGKGYCVDGHPDDKPYTAASDRAEGGSDADA
jgi:hypothetical protein